jgi:D-alanyl-D-alanine carboxypeptidase
MVSRGAAASLAPSWEPDDLVELPSLRAMSARECSHRGAHCLRREAALALTRMLAAMREDGVAGSVHSTYRSYAVQCMVFQRWAYNDGRGFCRAATGSALPGHSQHQLGTTLDLLSVAWKSQGRGLSVEFGCSPAGRWIAQNAEAFGFVLPYPLHVDFRDRSRPCHAALSAAMDPRTGYTYEPWHLRYIGPALTREFAAARAQSGIGTANELTLDQWLRRRSGRMDDADLPVCDGCACGACSTLQPTETSPCARDEMLLVDADGKPVLTDALPSLVGARARRDGERIDVDVTLAIPAGVVTQTPVAPHGEAVHFEREQRIDSWAWRRGALARAYRDLPGAVRVAVAPSNAPSGTFAYRAGLTNARAATAFNGSVVYLPAPRGVRTIRLSLVSSAPRVRVALWRDGIAIEPREITVTGGQ